MANNKIQYGVLHLNNCTITPAESDLPSSFWYSGNNVVRFFDLQANENYFFSENNPPIIILRGGTEEIESEFTINSFDNTKASFSINFAYTSAKGNYIVDVDATAITSTPTPETPETPDTPETPSNGFITFDEVNLTNCTCLNDLTKIADNAETIFILKANDGYRFEETPILSIWGVGQYHLEFEISSDKLTATLTVDFSEYRVNVVDINASAEPFVYYQNYGAINVYKVSFDNLNDFANVRYSNGKYPDLGEYIVTLKRFYCGLGETTPNKINVADFATNINCDTPLYDKILVDCGEITIPAVNNSALDYETELEIFLPFIGFNNISSDYVDKTISLVYEIDIIRGVGIAKLSCENVVFALFDCVPCVDVPFKPINYQSSMLANVDKSDYGLTPYIIVKSLTNENNNKTVSECKRMSLARDWTFGKWVDVDLPKLAGLNQEYTTIINDEIFKLLAEGVYLSPPK